MTTPVFVVADLDNAEAGGRVQIHGDEGRHAVSAKRMTAGELVQVVDGRGRRVSGVVAAIIDKTTADVAVQAVVDEAEQSPRFVVVQALAKGDRAELAVEQLTEVGIDEIVPWAAARSVVTWKAGRADRAAQRWRDAITAAGKQSRRARFPLLSALSTTEDVCSRLGAASLAVVLHEAGSVPIRQIGVPNEGEVVIVVGPEGGITEHELEQFAAVGARQVRLGSTVLRTSSAGMVAAGVLLSRTERWLTVEG